MHDFNGVSQWVQLGCSARTVGKTKMNEASSRSHAIFTVTMEQQRVIGMCVAPFVCASLTSANTGQTAVRKLPLSLWAANSILWIWLVLKESRGLVQRANGATRFAREGLCGWLFVPTASRSRYRSIGPCLRLVMWSGLPALEWQRPLYVLLIAVHWVMRNVARRLLTFHIVTPSWRACWKIR